MGKMVFVPEIGDVEFVRTNRSKFIRLKYSPGSGIKVSYPAYSSRAVALEFLNKRKDWIDKIRLKYKDIQNASLQEPDKKTGSAILKARLEALSQKYNLPYNGVSIKKMRTRWGSCSPKNKINLNLFLLNLPAELLDYVIVHELCHTLEKNHSKNFWHLLESFLPGSRKLDKKLNSYRLS